LEHSQHVRYGRSILPHRLGDLLLGHSEIVREPVIAFAFFDRIQVSTLQILDQRQGQDRFVVDLLDDRWNFFPAELGGGAESSLTSDELEPILTWAAAHRDRLQQTTRTQTLLQFGELIRLELFAWLKGIAHDLANRDRFERALITRGESAGVSEECLKSAAESAWRSLSFSGHWFLPGLFVP
jgi:hypothetical protein